MHVIPALNTRVMNEVFMNYKILFCALLMCHFFPMTPCFKLLGKKFRHKSDTAQFYKSKFEPGKKSSKPGLNQDKTKRLEKDFYQGYTEISVMPHGSEN